MVSSFCATLARRRAARVRVGPAVLFVRHGVCAWAYGVSFAASELCTFSFISSKATKFPIDHLQRIKVNYYLYHVTVWSVCPTKLILKEWSAGHRLRRAAARRRRPCHRPATPVGQRGATG